jgi:monofunctional glycosyltransferase
MVLAGLALVAAVLGLILLYRVVDPPTTPLIAATRLTSEVDQQWVSLERISPRLLRAVVASEDARFCSHSGIDFEEMRVALESAHRGSPRGASTITMQVVKNLFLWPGRSYVRKAIELPLALALDFLWPKRRILEVYLNIAEWGPGVFGAEAAARTAFGKSASRLTDNEAARLAVSLPNPAVRDPGDPDATVERLALRLEARMRAGVQLGCLR